MDRGLISMVIQIALCVTLVELLILALGKPRKVQRVTCGVLTILPIAALVLMHLQVTPWEV